MPDPPLPPNILQEISDFMREGEDTDTNWAWSEEDKKEWKVAAKGLQNFYNYWHEPEAHHRFDVPERHPYTLSLGDSETVLPVHPSATLDNKIVVTKSYNDTYYRILGIRTEGSGCRGAVLTGQPGIGKSLFLNFLLAWLISAQQVVLLSTAPTVLLFYQGKVYQREAAFFTYIPTHKFFHAWALIDADFKAQEPTRWQGWGKQFKAALLGMPLWNMEELKEGLPLHSDYNDFRIELEGSRNKQPRNDQIEAALAVLRRKEDEEKLQREEDEKPHRWSDGPSASGEDVEMTDSEDRSPDTYAEAADAVGKPPDIMETLMKNAIEEFGRAPRDVYRGVFDLPFVRHEHNEAVEKTDYSELAKFAIQFPQHLNFNPLSHELIAVEPIFLYLNVDSWKIEFKSARVLGKVMDSPQFREGTLLWDFYNSLHRSPGASDMAGHLFEQIVHRIFAHGWGYSVLRSQSTPMISDGNDPPTFSADPSSTPASVSLLPRLFTSATDVVEFDPMLKDLDVTVDGNKYYKLKVDNHALFDSFTVGRDLGGAVVISVFKITFSTTHGGSTGGYKYIRKIMGRVKRLLTHREPGTEIKVAYFLVCPEGERRQWRMPIGWNNNTAQGEAFCMRIRVPAQYPTMWIRNPR